MSKIFKPFPTSIKLVEDIDDRFYEINYCTGLCGQREHKEQRHSVRVSYFINTETPELFNKVKSIDMSCLSITKELLYQIKRNCPKANCFIINDTKFEHDAWLYFCFKVVAKLRPGSHLAIDNNIIVKENESIRLFNDFQLLFKNWRKPEALRVDFDERNETNGLSFAESFKSLGEIAFFNLNHFSNKRCYATCSCKIKSMESIEERKLYGQQLSLASIPMSNTNVILKHVTQKSPKLKYLRLHTDVCPLHVSDTLRIISQFKELIAIYFSFSNSFLNTFDSNCLEQHFRILANSLPKLEGLAVRMSRHLVDTFIEYILPLQFGKLTMLSLIGVD